MTIESLSVAREDRRDEEQCLSAIFAEARAKFAFGDHIDEEAGTLNDLKERSCIGSICIGGITFDQYRCLNQDCQAGCQANDLGSRVFMIEPLVVYEQSHSLGDCLDP